MPIDGRAARIAFRFPGANLMPQAVDICDTPIETLAGEYGKFGFHHVQPTAMFRREVEIQVPHDAPGFRRVEHFIESGRAMNVEIVQHHANTFGLRKVDIDQLLHPMRKVVTSAACSHHDAPPFGQWLKVIEQVAGAVALVFIVIALWPAWFDGARLTGFTNQLVRAFIKADHRTARIIGLGIEVEHIFHARDKFRADGWYAPLAA